MRATVAIAALALVLAGGNGLAAQQQRVPLGEVREVLAPLVESYGPSGQEGPVRETVQRLLPRWARPVTDSAGNLVLRLGRGDPVVVFVAHMDEIGFEVTEIRLDGSLELRALGGLFPSLFEAQPALVHTARGPVPGVFLPRDSAGPVPRRTPPALRVDLGVRSRAAAESLGVLVGSTITMPKAYASLAGTRATGRSFDDRVGSAAQVLAVRRLDPARLRHTVVFVWSVREEVGLDGARAVADALGTSVARVHAVDTFVSADAPLELPNYGLAPIGRGAVARALDNSSITPPAYVDSLAALAKRRGIALQVGTTSGGNDGSTFGPHGVVNVPIAWPLRYSHSPAEVVDLRDVASLAELIEAIAREW
jgi:putative aminopeptidase